MTVQRLRDILHARSTERTVAKAQMQETLRRSLLTDVTQAVQVSLYDSFFLAFSERFDPGLEVLRINVEDIRTRVLAVEFVRPTKAVIGTMSADWQVD